MQSLLGFLLCAVDMRLGVATVMFFLLRHFRNEQAREKSDEKAAMDKEKADLMKQLKEAKAAGLSSREMAALQGRLAAL